MPFAEKSLSATEYRLLEAPPTGSRPFRRRYETRASPAGSPHVGHIVEATAHSAVVGSMMALTSDTRFAGNPPCLACSRTIASFGAMYTQ
jgi:hypothetical protein